MDEYDYLEAQLEAGGAPAAAQPEEQALPPPPPANGTSERSKDKERSSKHRSRSRSRDKDKDKDRKRRSRSRDKDRGDRKEPRSSRDRSRDRRDRDRDRDREKEHRDRREDRQSSRGRSRDRRPPEIVPVRRERTPPEVRLQREKEQEQRDLERTVRTVMIMNLNLKAEERDVFVFFSTVGKIIDIKLIRDKNTKRSKGIAYIEFESVQGAMAALTLNGQILLSMPVMVKPSEAEKNLQWEAQQQAKQNQAAAVTLLNKMGGTAPGVKLNPIKLQILNLHPDIGEDDLKELFLPFGEINYVRVVRDAVGASTGEAFVQYADKPMADNAITHFNGFEIAGKKLQVQVSPVYNPSAGLSATPPLPAAPPVNPAAAAAAVISMGGAGVPGFTLPPPPAFGAAGVALPGPPPMPGAGYPGFPDPAAAAAATAAQPTIQVPGPEVDDLDEAENKSFRLNAQGRAALMSRLASSAGLQVPYQLGGAGGAGAASAPGLGAAAAQQPAAAPAQPALHVPQAVLLEQGLLGPASPIPTPCLLLKNMFSDADKGDPNWQEEVADDVRSEAVKFGQVLHCYVNPDSKGHVYLKFATPQAAEAASRTLHGRYYSGNQIVAAYQFLQPYNNYFGL